MEALGANSWAFTQNLLVLGVPMGTRMTICRDKNERLFVHSPNALTGAIQEQVAALGQVAVLFSPNIYHHMYVADWQRAWPNALHVAPTQLVQKRPDLAYQHLLDDESPDAAPVPWTCPGST